jgi:gliding motility-associated-like protein
MKKIFLIITSLFSIVSFSQAITVNTSTYSVPQLVTDILVNKPCVPVTNITWRTGNTNGFGSTNGIGYFQNTNPNFPLTSGVVLTTGNVLNAPGPNTTQLDDGNTAWTGDNNPTEPNLEATLLAAGITMNSTNATVLEFDFVPFSSNFNFQFLFASEEYGNFQCKFSDAFAFLLTNTSTGVTTNLAVVPSTTTPISVVTIRDFLYNSSCPSANPAYFGAINGGSAAAGSATNFNGQTVVMNASSSTLVPNTTYHIKLVIADRQDNKADSAIFLGANSFNVGQDVLGQDLTIATNTAICNNNTHTITSGLNPLVYSFAWTFNGNAIGGNTPNLTVNQAGVYGLTYTIISSNCVVTTDFINIEYYNSITTPNPVDLYKCNSGQPDYTFDLSYNTPIVNITGTQISYHASLPDAISNNSPLPNNYNVLTGNLPKTIWIRILDTATGCVTTKTFQLALTPPPVANNPGNMTLCETSLGSGVANFNLASQTNAVLAAQSSAIYGVSYYTNATDATTGTNPIDTTVPFSSGNTTIFVRIQNTTDPVCFNTTSFNLIVIPRPVLDVIPNQYVCVSYTLPVLVNPGNYYSGPNQGLPMLNAGDVITVDSTIYIYYETGGSPSCPSERSFRVEIVTLLDITPTDVIACDQYLLPVLDYNSRYFTAPGGPSGGGTELFGGSTLITTPGVTTIYIYFVSTDVPPCTVQSQFNVTINVTPTITGSFPNVFDCVAYNLPPLAVGNYYTFDSLTGLYTLAVSPITTTTTLYVFATNNNCRTPDIVFTAYIGTLGITNVTQCLSYTLPALPIGEYRDAPNGGGNIIPSGTVITSTTNVYTYVPGAGTPNCTDDDFFTITINAPFLTTPTDVTTCASYTLPVQADGGTYYSGTNQGLPMLNAGDVITTTATIYIYKASTTSVGCYNEKPWLITINQKPIIDSRADVEQCRSYVLSPLTNGNYFDDPNGVNPLSAGDTITTNNTIYIYAANPNDATCFSQNSFNISINGVEADPIPTQLTYCNSFTFPPHATANNFYYDATGGPTGGGNIIPAGTTVTSATVLPTYYIYYETGDRLNCSDENPFTITINDTPVLTPAIQSVINVCDSYTLQPLTIGKYYTLTGGPSATGNTEIVAPITYNLLNPAPTTIYAYAETNTTPNCPVEQPMNITIFNVTEPASVTRCSSYTLPSLPAGQNYYSNSGGVGLLASNVISTTQNIYVFGFSGFTPNCSDEFMFTVTIVPRPVANTVSIPQECDTFGNNDGIFAFDLTTLLIRNQVLNGQTPDPDFTLTFYTSFADANNPLATPIATPSAYQNDNPFTDSVWIRVTNNTLTDPCFAITELRLVVNLLPDPILEPEYFICSDYEKGTILNFATLDTGLSGANYSFAWTLDGNPFGGNTPSITTNQIGNYSVTVTDNSTTPPCPKTITTIVTKYAPYIEITYSDAFENPTFISVNVLGAGSGNYEYRLDEEPYQDSNIFYNVSPGNHRISVNDKSGHCNPAPTKAEIINYPKFFTPNGDGFHETWNIIHLKTTNPNAPILIFDRFGKLIKQITPSSDGWNGTFNGKPLPSTDYWFTVDYSEKGASKVFKSHFALKR